MTRVKAEAPVAVHRRRRLWKTRRTGRSDFERVRRYTFWTLLSGAAVAWLAPIAGVAERVGRGEPLLWATPVWVVGLVVFTVCYVTAVKAAVADRPYTRPVLISGVVALIVLATDDMGVFTGAITAAWAGIAAIKGSVRRTLLIWLGSSLVTAALSDPDVRGLNLSMAVWMGMVIVWANRFQLWLWKVLKAASEGREAQARLAVTEERLRFARDMHDLVGHSLSAIAVKSELAAKLAVHDGSRAAAEMTEVQGLARESLREIRAAVRGYRTVDFDAELRSVRAVLEAAGIRCGLDLPDAVLPEEVGTLLAWVVREGTTNVLRHSTARRCHIAVTVEGGQGGTAVLQMTNDGVERRRRGQGSGLAGLSERTAALGGSLTAGPTASGGYLLRAAVPMEGVV
ncbi:two-component system, NarL family, sensor histidine kinase DesK [Sinosporangium album]|uniref:Two-component system, NarL family, sensor histidine kinase DesK n=1 Tax=Sinosporangium album TaxID=504805 RepID=A0A1G7V4Q3_9ACTN|nr:histidine kinase [Sinosporangium album]SDG54548.1 two-component system, NarL family, sensor histidine kinase DesK [Sinosporangium album]